MRKNKKEVTWKQSPSKTKYLVLQILFCEKKNAFFLEVVDISGFELQDYPSFTSLSFMFYV